ncbi:UDP-N-acetylmuramoyl-tripeptide--D-alanyl-D-alanine ligase [Brevibacillus humidisoli]|uniref:UDP-N-acetylmuramoyl-tripeptide--D-alanyl-D- alanine ligase n=1 Tax=Brevibacillus humidisoli TaxID=2895522 RepID=UPI001E2C4081|nr:UDP-N-acetylmuramoyl-tripeptide--D-alanyl-D-alanine ligase [Brevibacillus humidisoli]UFJ42656.1 UDP-N-acetylmuramoyl-tripeptide--D-alanyl-D-alanine ligase [Brevibacillus humidisoli]
MPGILGNKRPIIAVTGSAGKTTTKEMVAAILSARNKIFKSVRNKNTWVNTRAYKKQINASHRAVVLEYGMLRAGQIKKHCQMIQPNIGVVTNVGTAHIGNFGGSIRGIARAKSELIQHMRPRGVLFLNADDVNSRMLLTKGFKGRIFKVGINNPAQFKAFHIREEGNGVSFDLKLRGQVHTFHVPLPGRHNVYNALFAIAIAHCLGYPVSAMQRGLRRFARPQRRLSTFRGRDGIVIIDDTFSANPNAVRAAIDVLQQNKGPKIAVLGAMLEMGKYHVRGHKGVGRYIAKKGIDYLFTFGKNAALIGKGAVEAGFPAAKVIHCNTREVLHRKLLQKIQANSSILVKGSHKVKMNLTAAFLRKRFARQKSN